MGDAYSCSIDVLMMSILLHDINMSSFPTLDVCR